VSWRRPGIGNAGFARAGTATSITSIPSRSYCRIQALQFYAGIGGGEVPIGFDLFFCSAVLPGGDPRPGSACWRYADRATNPTIRAVGFNHVRPTAVFWGVVLLELFDVPTCFGDGKSFVGEAGLSVLRLSCTGTIFFAFGKCVSDDP
jgi:hypothetical protein